MLRVLAGLAAMGLVAVASPLRAEPTSTEAPAPAPDGAPAAAASVPEHDVAPGAGGAPSPAASVPEHDVAPGAGGAPSPAAAGAPEITLKGPLAGAPSVGRRVHELGAKVSERFVMPSGYAEVAGELAFITAAKVLTPKALSFGDVVLFRPTARRSFGDRLELSLGASLLAKQPTGGRDRVLQGASFGAVLEPWNGYALRLDGGLGPLLGGHGSVWSLTPGVAAKWALESDARVLLSLSNAFTALDRQGALRASSWLDELVLGAEAELGRGGGGGWVGLDYAVPLAHAGERPGPERGVPLHPSVRVDLQVGGLLRVGPHYGWDLYCYYAFVDRGEADRPSTTLPILDGGFDQHQIVLGVAHRFEPSADATR